MSIYLGTSPVANTGYNKADTDLSNLASTGKNIANWSSNVTNCITEIPQDIKLELNNGTLTLKAGSKVYVPNGPGVFDVVTIENDVTHISTVTGTNKQLLFYRLTSNSINCHWNTLNCFSGTTTPTQQTYIYYNTTTNQIRYTISGTTYSNEVVSLPIAEITLTDGQFTSIDKVFNGFGYIGSTAFALPGVKGLIPNGRNADGTLKNNEYTINSVLTHTTLAQNAVAYLAVNNSMVALASKHLTTYKEKENYVFDEYVQANANWSALGTIITNASAKIDCFEVNSVFHTLDYNDKGTIAGWSMPSSRYIDLTLGASGANYTAPANGWFYLRKRTTGNQSIAMGNNKNTAATKCFTASGSSNEAYCFLPVLKGDGVWVTYYAAGETTYFRFVYAEGENV